MTRAKEPTPMMLARIAGVLYLLLAFIGPFSLMYVPSKVMVPGDAIATASNILASEGLFRAGFLGDSAILLIEIPLIAVLYVLLRPVSKTLALAAAFARMAMVVVQGLNMLPNFVILQLVNGHGPAFTPDQLGAMVQLCLDARVSGVLIWEVFFALHLALIGYLFYRSRYIPRVFGILLYLASFGYFVDSFGNMLYPAGSATYAAIVAVGSIVGEMALTLWLLIKGVRVPATE